MRKTATIREEEEGYKLLDAVLGNSDLRAKAGQRPTMCQVRIFEGAWEASRGKWGWVRWVHPKDEVEDAVAESAGL